MKIKLFSVILAVSLIFMSCNNSEDMITNLEIRNPVTEGTILGILSEDNPIISTEIDGQPVTISITSDKKPSLRAAMDVVGPFYTVNKKVKTGKYEKVANLTGKPGDVIPKHSYGMIRFDTYEFDAKVPSTGYGFSLEIRAENPGYDSALGTGRGFIIVYQGVTNNTMLVTCRYFIRNGAAYNILGQQLTPDIETPINSSEAKYSYTYLSK